MSLDGSEELFPSHLVDDPVSAEVAGDESPAWWPAQDCAALGDQLIRDMDRIQTSASKTAEEYADAAFAVFVPAVKSRDEEIRRLRTGTEAEQLRAERDHALKAPRRPWNGSVTP